MLVARSRGISFWQQAGQGHFWPCFRGSIEAYVALLDVAQALGYVTAMHYNEACLDRPDEVRARLAAL